MPDSAEKLWPKNPPAPDTPSEDNRVATVPRHDCSVLDLSEVTPEPIKWLWQGRIPLGMFSLLAGHPGVGKSTIAFSIAAIVSNGGKWPFSPDRAEPGHVIILTAEDDPKYILVPRLMAADANLTRISVIQSVARVVNDDHVIDAPLLLSEDMHQLHGVLDQYADTRLLIIDPLSAYLGVKDSHRDSDVRQVLGPLTDLASQHEVSILGISHLNKSAGNSAIARFMGSTGIIAAARAAFLATKHEDELMLLPVKSNVAPDIGGLIYRIKGATIAGDIETSVIEWTGETEIEANEVLSQKQARTRSPRLMDAMDFLDDQLQHGPKRQVEIEKAATPAGHTEGTLKRARKELNITSRKDQFSGGWKWYTPEQFTAKIKQEKRQS